MPPRRPASSLAVLALVGAAAVSGALLLRCARPPDPRPSVLVLVVDALRADHVGCQGYGRDTTPSIDALARTGVRFARAVSPSNQTRTAMPSLWTGLLPSRHGVFRRDDVVRDELVTAAEVLAAAGWETAAWAPNPSLDHALGHAQGWQTYVDRTLRPGDEALAWQRFETARRINAGFLQWLDRRGGRPFLAWLHYRDVHGPYVPPPPHDRAFAGPPRPLSADEIAARPAYLALPGEPEDLQRYVDLYDGGILHADGEIGRLLAELRRRGVLERTFVILTADHGEAFLEHGQWEHGRSLFEEELHVPLVVAGPGIAPRVVSRVVSTADLFATVLELAGVEPPAGAGVDSSSLVPLLAGDEAAYGREAAVAEAPAGEGSVARAWREGDWKLVADWQSRSVGLYDLSSDPAERANRFDDPAAADAAQRLWSRLRPLAEELERARGAAAPRADLPDDLRERLESLGYVR